jgi:hypothetical protein
MVHFVSLVGKHELLKLLHKDMHLAEVQWAEVGVEGLIDEVFVNAKVKCVLTGLGWRFVGDPVQPLGNDLDGHKLGLYRR